MPYCPLRPLTTIHPANDGSSPNNRIERLSWSGQNISGIRLTVTTSSIPNASACRLDYVALTESDSDLIPGSRFLQNHLLIEPVAALLEREETGYRDLRKAIVSLTTLYDRARFWLT